MDGFVFLAVMDTLRRPEGQFLPGGALWQFRPRAQKFAQQNCAQLRLCKTGTNIHQLRYQSVGACPNCLTEPAVSLAGGSFLLHILSTQHNTE
jgi:hypothetical protein